MFPQFGATADGLSKASSLVFRIGSDAHLYDDPDDVSIAPLLDSRFDTEKAEALKRLFALIAQGADVSNFFPQVVKNVASQSLEVKKLVYLYLLHYAEKRPDEALLSINCFQKDLSDTNPLVRAWALRAMAGIRLHAVAPLVLVAITKCARDPSAYVRKCAAHALPKLHDLRLEENTSALEEIVSILLSDHSPGVVGAAAAAFKTVCPNNLTMIGKIFRRLCETVPDVEEWGQIVLIEILLRYVIAKHGLVKDSIMLSSGSNSSFGFGKHWSSKEGGELPDSDLNMSMLRYYIEGEEHSTQFGYTDEYVGNLPDVVMTSIQNDDVRTFLRCTSPLLWSQNSAVVLASAGVHWIMAPKEEVSRIIKPLLFTMRSSTASKYVILCNIQFFVKVVPSLFTYYFEDFFICSSDSYQIKAIKLEILSTIATESSIPIIFEEFQDYIRDPDRRFIADTVAAIGLCAQRLPSVANTCLEGLLALTIRESSTDNLNQMDGEANVLVQAIVSIKSILKQNPSSYEKVIVHLARNLEIIREPSARALIVWIVGEYNSVGQIISKILPTLLKYFAWCFTSEDVETKHQILSIAAKVTLCARGEELCLFKKIFRYIIELAKYDQDYDVRDRARTIEKLVPCHEGDSLYLLPEEGIFHEFSRKIFSGKFVPPTYPVNNFRFYLPGSLSQIVLHAAPGYVPLPKPCTLLDIVLHETKVPTENIGGEDPFEFNDRNTISESSIEESGSCDSRNSYISSVDSDSYENDNASFSNVHGSGKDEEKLLVHLSDAAVDGSQKGRNAGENFSKSFSSDLSELMSRSALESWLDEQPALSSGQKSGQLSSARISINDLDFSVEPENRTLLDPANGDGLRVQCAYSSELSPVSPLLICVEFTFGNYSAEPLMQIRVEDEESSGGVQSDNNEALEEHERNVPSLLPMKEIALLDPGKTAKAILQLRFYHHLLPRKLAVLCNGRRHLIKLRPEIGYFVRPLSMGTEAFIDKESRLPGMFEYTKRGVFTDHIKELGCEDQHSINTDKVLVVSRSLASKVLSNSNLHLVSVDMPVSFNIDDASGLRLRFSGEILSCSNPCLITVTAEGKCSETLNITVKVNCEETVFGLNLLNRVASFLQ